MRPVALLCLASLVAVAACEVAFPFDRSLIPEEAGVSELDSGYYSEDTGSPFEDAATAPDEGTDATADAHDAATTSDGSPDAPTGAVTDATTDAAAIPDAAADASADGADADDASGD